MADPKPHLDPEARRGEPHSQFWYDLAINDPEALNILEDIVIAEHSHPITIFGDHRDHIDQSAPHPLNAAGKGMFLGFPFGLFFGLTRLGWNPDMIYVTKKGPVVTIPTTKYIARTTLLPAIYIGTIGSTYLGVRALSYNIRGENDQWNSIYGGFCSGLVMGSVTKRMDHAFLFGLGIAAIAGAGDYYKRNAGSLFAWDKERVMQRHWGVRPYQHRESDDLTALKETYPQHKNL